MKKQVTTKISQQTADLIAEMATNTNRFASDIYAKAIENYALNPNNSAENSAEIENLNSKIHQLETSNYELQQKLSAAEQTISEQQAEINSLQTSIDYLQNQEAPEAPALQLTESEQAILNEITADVNQRTRSNFTALQLLFKVFYMQATEGAGDWLPRIYKKR